MQNTQSISLTLLRAPQNLQYKKRKMIMLETVEKSLDIRINQVTLQQKLYLRPHGHHEAGKSDGWRRISEGRTCLGWNLLCSSLSPVPFTSERLCKKQRSQETSSFCRNHASYQLCELEAVLENMTFYHPFGSRQVGVFGILFVIQSK